MRLIAVMTTSAQFLNLPPIFQHRSKQIPRHSFLHAITQVYGTTMKAVIHEMFGDGIMSAIDFEIDIQKNPTPRATGW